MQFDPLHSSDWLMELQPSWGDYTYAQIASKHLTTVKIVPDSFGETTHNNDEHSDDEINDEHCSICINSILPDDILEQVLCHLPFATVMKACCVCKQWNDIVHSERFMQNLSTVSSRKPWYFMFTSDNDPNGHVYDPLLSKWYKFHIPFVASSSWTMVSSSGLVCLMDEVCRRRLYVCNPITRHSRKLLELPDVEFADYCALTISLDTTTSSSPDSYIVSVVKSKQAQGEELYWDLSIHIYTSKNSTWDSPRHFTLEAWRGGVDSVICNGVLYFVVYLTRALGYITPRFGLIPYDLSSSHFPNIFPDEQVILAPCSMSCMRVLNLEEELVMVGGIEKQGRPGVVKGIGIWVLRGKKEWEEVSRMPSKYFKGFGELDDVFKCSGLGKTIYIQSYGSPALLMFDMDTETWKWAHKCPAAKKSALQLFSGVCFQPRLDIVP